MPRLRENRVLESPTPAARPRWEREVKQQMVEPQASIPRFYRFHVCKAKHHPEHGKHFWKREAGESTSLWPAKFIDACACDFHQPQLTQRERAGQLSDMIAGADA